MKFRTKEEIMSNNTFPKDTIKGLLIETLIDIRDLLAAELSLRLNTEPQIEHIGLCPYCKEPGICTSTFDDKKDQYLCCNKDCSHPNHKWEGKESR